MFNDVHHAVNGTDILKSWTCIQERLRADPDLTESFRSQLTTQSWWKEWAGLFILCPRQSGKTTALCNFSTVLKRFHPQDELVGVAYYDLNRELLSARGDFHHVLEPQPTGEWIQDSKCNVKHSHLLVDEFMLLGDGYLSYLLSFPWKSVTMIGTMS